MHPLFRDSPVPRYSQLADLLRQRIARGVWGHGEKLPSLEALMREFDVARVTVRQAVELLSRDGLLSPQQGRGTFVTGRPAQDRWLRLETSLHDLADVYRDDKPKLTLIEEAAASPALTPRDGKPAPRYHFMRRVHSRNDEAYCVISIYLDERIFRMAPRRFRRETVVPVLLELPKVKIAKAPPDARDLHRRRRGGRPPRRAGQLARGGSPARLHGAGRHGAVPWRSHLPVATISTSKWT